ncbi:MAG: hypothetical protein J5814_01960 [Bacteroidaceae bacterium]|nr:hypothetical protein [Bacteroidaceae bacterium]
MRKILFAFLTCLIPVLSVKSEITVRVDAETRGTEMTKDVQGYCHLYAEGMRLVTEAGAPEIPYMLKTFYVPYNAVNVKLVINEGERIPIYRDYTPFPSQGLVKVGSDDETADFIPLAKEYQSGIYPKVAAEIVSEEIIMKQNLVNVALYPFLYDAEAHILYRRTLDVSITYQTDARKETMKPIPSENRRNAALSLVRSMVENPEDVEMPTANHTGQRRIQPLQTGGDGTYVPDYIIITSPDLVGTFQPLAEWKTRTGIPTIIETTEYIDEHYEGVDLCERIRNYLEEKEEQWGVALYILLGGDASIIPSREYNGHEFREVTDAYYVNRSSKWFPSSESLNNIPFNINSHIGRFPIKNAQEASLLIEKIIRYEKASENIDYSYVNNHLVSLAYIYHSGNYFGNGSMRNVYNATHTIPKNFWYQFDFFNRSSPATINGKTYSFSNAITNIQYGEDLTRANFLRALSHGAGNWEHFHLVWHEDHSERSVMGTSSEYLEEEITSYDIDTLSFDDSYYQVIISSGCHPADFRTTCIGKSFLMKSNKGAVAFIGNVDVGWSTEHSSPLVYTQNLYDSLSISCHRLGNIWLRMLDEGCSLKCRLHLLGDPTMAVWTNEPQNITATKSIENNAIKLQFPTNYAGKVSVCAYKKGELYDVQSVSSSLMYIPVNTIKKSGYVYLTYTGLDYRPLVDSIYVGRGDGSRVQITVNEISDDLSGNNDGIISSGESVRVQVTMRNTGSTPVYGLWAELKCSDPNITLIDDLQILPVMNTNTSYNRTFSFRALPTCPDRNVHNGNPIYFYFESTDNDSVYYDDFVADVYEPKIKPAEFLIKPRQGYLNQYEVTIDFANVGTVPIENPYCILTTNNPFVQMITDSINLATIYPGFLANYGAFVIETTDPMNETEFDLFLKDENGWTEQMQFYNGETPLFSNTTGIKLTAGATYVDFELPEREDTAYHIYRDNGERLTIYPVSNHFRDNNLTPQTTYSYNITYVLLHKKESDFSPTFTATTLCEKLSGFPKRLLGSKIYTGGVIAWDVDRDGKQEIFAKYRNWIENKTSVVAIRANGSDLYTDLDNYITEDIDPMPANNQNGPAVGELMDDGVQYLVSSTYRDSLHHINYISCYSLDNFISGNAPSPILQWSGDSLMCPRSPIIADMDGDDAYETIIPSYSRTIIFSSNDTVLASIAKKVRYCAPAVASVIPNSDDKQLIFPADGTMYAYNKYGTQLAILHTTSGKKLTSPVVCDIDGDGINEVVFGEWNETDNIVNVEYKYAKYNVLNSSFDVSYLFSNSCRVNGRKDFPISVGDVNNDGLPDLVSYGSSFLKIYNSATGYIASKYLPSSDFNSEFTLIADVNGDNYADIIYVNYSTNHTLRIHAVDYNGNKINDFGLLLDEKAGEDMMAADIDGDGKTELIVGELCGQMSVWKTKGNPDKIEWGMVRGDAQNTGEYHKIVHPQLKNNGTYSSPTDITRDLYVTGNSVNVSTTLDIDDHKKIIVWEDGVMNLTGATLNNAKVIVKDGGEMNMSGSSAVNLRDAKTFSVDMGGRLSVSSGSIK